MPNALPGQNRETEAPRVAVRIRWTRVAVLGAVAITAGLVRDLASRKQSPWQRFALSNAEQSAGSRHGGTIVATDVWTSSRSFTEESNQVRRVRWCGEYGGPTGCHTAAEIQRMLSVEEPLLIQGIQIDAELWADKAEVLRRFGQSRFRVLPAAIFSLLAGTCGVNVHASTKIPTHAPTYAQAQGRRRVHMRPHVAQRHAALHRAWIRYTRFCPIEQK